MNPKDCIKNAGLNNPVNFSAIKIKILQSFINSYRPGRTVLDGNNIHFSRGIFVQPLLEIMAIEVKKLAFYSHSTSRHFNLWEFYEDLEHTHNQWSKRFSLPSCSNDDFAT